MDDYGLTIEVRHEPGHMLVTVGRAIMLVRPVLSSHRPRARGPVTG